MKRRAQWGIFLGLLLAAAALGIALQPGKGSRKHTLSFPVMGTVATLTFYTDSEHFKQAAAEIQKEFAEISRIANRHDSTSEISRLNKEAARKPFQCTPALWEILTEARLAHRLSEGAFDISIAPLMTNWGFYRQRSNIPAAAETAGIKALTGLEKITFDDRNRTVKFPRPGFALDLGGIAKGYAIERAYKKALLQGITRGVIDLGGNLRLLPLPPPGRRHYMIGIRRPGRKNGGVMPEILHLPGNLAVSSSGDYERFVTLEGKTFGHIIDPATGIPAPGKRAVTAISDRGIRSDWLSTAVYLRGKKLSEKLEKSLPNTRFVIIER